MSATFEDPDVALARLVRIAKFSKHLAAAPVNLRDQSMVHSSSPDTRVVPVVRAATTASLQRPSQNRRQPAPRSRRRLRPILVPALALTSLVGVVGMVGVGTHPNWFATSHRAVHSSLSGRSVPSPRNAGQVALMSATSTAITYRVPVASYSIVVTVEHPCWLVVKSPATDQTPLAAMTLMPTSSPYSITVHGSASITIAAQASSIAIADGSRTLHSVTAPILDVAYTFIPPASKNG